MFCLFEIKQAISFLNSGKKHWLAANFSEATSASCHKSTANNVFVQHLVQASNGLTDHFFAESIGFISWESEWDLPIKEASLRPRSWHRSNNLCKRCDVIHMMCNWCVTLPWLWFAGYSSAIYFTTHCWLHANWPFGVFWSKIQLIPSKKTQMEVPSAKFCSRLNMLWPTNREM